MYHLKWVSRCQFKNSITKLKKNSLNKCLVQPTGTNWVRFLSRRYSTQVEQVSKLDNGALDPGSPTLYKFLLKDQKKSGDLHLHTAFNLCIDELLINADKGRIKSLTSKIHKHREEEAKTPISRPWKEESTKTMTDGQIIAYLKETMPYQYASLYHIFYELKSLLKSKPSDQLKVLDCGKGPSLGAILSQSFFPSTIPFSVVEENSFLREIIKQVNQTIGASLDSENLNPELLGRLPLSQKGNYDLVIASNRLLECGSDEELFGYLRALWSLLNKGGIVILTEQGSKHGFHAIKRARSFLLNREKDKENDRLDARILAPCPHEDRCPINIEGGVRANVCNFKQHFFFPSFSRLYVPRSEQRSQSHSKFSYVVLQKGVTRESNAYKPVQSEQELSNPDFEATDSHINWPRIIRSPLKRRGHVIVDVCDHDAQLRRHTVPKSQGKLYYQIARKSNQGDRFPIKGKVQSVEQKPHTHKPLEAKEQPVTLNSPLQDSSKVSEESIPSYVFTGKRYYSTRPYFRQNSFKCSEPAKGLLINKRYYSRRYTINPKLKYERQTTINYLIALTILVLGITYASVPLYRLFCSKTGYGGTVNTDQERMNVDRMVPRRDAKRVRVTFNGDVAGNLRWKLYPQQKEIWVQPGETALAFYTAENFSDEDIVGVATYNIVPGQAAVYFSKVACFCFEEQKLDAREKVDLPVFFFLDPEFVDDPNMKYVDDILLSYTFFEAKYDNNGNLLTQLN
ncbi:cytochrome c oxidase assembly protein Cox1101/ mitochondrial ribosomal protein Rsm22 fusion protein [Schizosaccharomyces osmophilus]|uniref:Cytochrome c oxidase assembly protein Cox1101/ mitochondrial ribosomal protein Rsm22 fusion protein n=1 Tax=Schizosaccharomyces osmophilus TaxID=2545709 RepID=A0AAF0AVV3_9SCHI|nr:cytochrome c oxidase assembly protein Cox1101/ mitochondrial ribosomal protein Rsm22 fusion protein [Schizosaccharomyces osmophilus]WBW72858.1 cytochrome c oxidase assembly protein Cox1101/ mitochondrial ribosomal protein Rsm22 fusion protein [Schizosaccharomyces osmophilus]